MKRFFIFLSVLLVTGCGKHDYYQYPKDVVFSTNNTSCNVFEDDCNLYSFIGDNNVEILTKDKVIDTSKTGKFKETISFKYKKKEYRYDITYNIVDVVPPVFINTASSVNVLVNNDTYPCNDVVIGDNYDRTPTCEIEGDYDLTTPGKYKVKYVIKDESNNTNEMGLTINVYDELSQTSYTPPKKIPLKLEDVIRTKKNNNTKIGIDVSRWQENIDFNRVKEAGVEFVIMRIGVNSDIDKDLSIDSYYKQNIANAKAAGLMVGVYVYSSAIDNKTALEHAKWTVETLNGEKLDFPVAYDWENWSKFRKYGISINDLDNTFYTFSAYLKENGYDAMLYSSKNYLEKIWNNKFNNPVWLAHYTNETNYQGDYILWQMSNVGRVDGINGDVDIDIMYIK